MAEDMNAQGAARGDDVREMLEAIRDIEQVIQRRADRIMGTVQIVRALAVAAVFGFYQLVWWNPAPFQAVFGPLTNWMWIPILVLARVATMVITARLERTAREQGVDLKLKRTWLPAIVGGGAALVFALTGRFEYAPGIILAAIGAVTLPTAGRSGPRLAILWRAYAAFQIVAGLLLLAFRPTWELVAMASIFVAGGLTLGTLRYNGFR